MHKINKKQTASSSPTLASKKDISELHQVEGISINSGTETDLSEINQIEARCNEEKPQETPNEENFFQENQNCDEVTVERKDKKKLAQCRRTGSLKRKSIMQ